MTLRRLGERFKALLENFVSTPCPSQRGGSNEPVLTSIGQPQRAKGLEGRFVRKGSKILFTKNAVFLFFEEKPQIFSLRTVFF